MPRIVLSNVRVNGAGDPQVVTVADGRIQSVGAQAPADLGPADHVEDLGGQILLPGFVDGHAHADKSMWGEPWARRTSAPITMEQMFEDTLRQWEATTTPVATRARAFLDKCVTYGSTSIRTFADVAPEIGLDGVHGMLQVREEMAELTDLSIVAFPQLGLLRKPGTAELLEQALRDGADAIGGIDPAGVDGDASRQLDVVFGLAEKYQVPVDFHLHESGELGIWLIERIAARVKALGMRHKVSLCDVFSLADPTPAQLAHLGSVLAEAGITVAVGVHGLLPVPDVKALHAMGVRMCLGSDSSRSLWSPWGEGDILSRAMFMAYKCYWRRDEDLEFAVTMGTTLGRQALGFEACDLKAGDVADLVVLPGEAIGEIVVAPPQRTLVMKRGKIVARSGALTVGAAPGSGRTS
ncbi:cytosine deaminase [Sphaerisporangium krabiense]|uniref:Cytosine deaminase n=1 Tax=Sphaerisporangium krabiense TaxID=763782 RepID=A0A7W8Z275_9ACTN|nr:amidohydrolase [Sphaerisporangium krabiense]MBB5626074.1 cytosine deaminase [Sphaerisporangium krabiense]GII64878.1 cytosine deaminase [Sphaerisporangium krabiense]